MNYTTAFCVLEAACLLILFSQVKIVKPGMVKTISFVSSNSLGIYLIQNYPYFWENFIVRCDPPIYEPIKYLWYLPGMIVAVMIVGVLGNFIVDKLYQWIGLDRLCRKIFVINK
jgi:surface polysaccharide O-acyltransferase-like enzyme